MKIEFTLVNLKIRQGTFILALTLLAAPLGAQEEQILAQGGADPAQVGEGVPVEGGDVAMASAGGGAQSSSGAGVPGANSSVPGANDLLNFQTDLFTGRFSYSVPIIVPPGRQGAEPKIALGYNSAAGNSWCGVGWSLDVGFIERETKKGVPIAWGNHNVGTQYDDAQGFVFNLGGAAGSLVNVGGNVYRNEIDATFLKFVLQSTNTWIVTDKSGNRFFFGESSASRMQNTTTGWTADAAQSTFRWALSRVIDVNGNETKITYTTHSNYLYLAEIAYNGNINTPSIAADHTVTFTLTNRSDDTWSFRPGYAVMQKKLLHEVLVKVNTQRIRRYVLAYNTSPSTFRSMLQSVTMYGPTDSDSMPPTTFTYQVKPFEFESAVTWTVNDQNTGSDYWGGIRSSFDDDYITYDWVTLMDIDGDALPDRVIRYGNSPYDHFLAQRNTGSGFDSQLKSWGEFNAATAEWGSTENTGYVNEWLDSTGLRVVDLNGDGYPDRILGGTYDGDNFIVRTNTGLAGATNSFPPAVVWGATEHETATGLAWFQIAANTVDGANGEDHVFVELLDITGDGLRDRVTRKQSANYTYYVIQKNTGAGFTTWRRYGPLLSNGADEAAGPNSISYTYKQTSPGDYTVTHRWMMLADMNGDGLVDRVIKTNNPPYNMFMVQFNNGAGFHNALYNWGPNDGQGEAGVSAWFSPYSSHLDLQGGDSGVNNMLIDLNGDGLLDRVMRKRPSNLADYTYPYFVVQFNTGTGFTGTNHFTGLESSDTWYWRSPQYTDIQGSTHYTTKADLVDMNGDGLVDRVYWVNSTTWKVQYNKGPFPDLLSRIDNGIGGKVDVTYVPSTQFNNRDKVLTTGDPWTDGAKALLPFAIYVVETVAVRDGFGNTNKTTYNYAGGMYDGKRREFRGFSHGAMTDAYGAKTRIMYHQGGGRDWTSLGEHQDPGSLVKKGIPFRIETMGTDGTTNTVTINKVEEVMLHTNGWCFPYISQVIQLEYEGTTNYRATAQQFLYDTNSGNVLKVSNLGEVTSVNASNHTFTDDGNDSIYTHTTYASLGDILNKPEIVIITSDSPGNTKLRETRFAYDSRGNLTNQQAWLTGSTYLTATSIQYDQNGNPSRITDAAGIATDNTYDTTYQMFVEKKVTSGFTNHFRYNPNSGALLLAIDAKGSVASNQYDAFFRLTNTWISTNIAGDAFIWKERYEYNLGGISANLSYNYVRKRVNDAIDANGHQTTVYADGLGRAIQTRVEAETGQFRVTDAFYDLLGKPLFATLPRFESGSAYTIITGPHIGTYTEYDTFGRAFRTTPAVKAEFSSTGALTNIFGTGGDTGSPVAAATTAFSDGSNPWATVITDPEGKVKKSYHDAFGRTTTIIEVTSGGNLSTLYKYDKLGNLTNVTDAALNQTRIVYDNLGRKTSMVDPDMGTWTYAYDNASRLIQQIDAKNQKIEFVYTNDSLGRLTARKIYNTNNVLVATIAYAYDSNGGDPTYPVFKGQLFKVTDREGWSKFGYDIRGRVIIATRYVNTNGASYTIQTTYDDADRPSELTYPGSPETKLKYVYDTAGHLSVIHSLAGTGSTETFYSLPVFNALGQLTSCKYGTNQVVTYAYYPNSKRLTNKVVTVTTNLQNLSYQYDKVSNLQKITDGARPGGSNSATITSFAYDDLHRLTQINSAGLGVTRSYTYNAIGNITTNQDFGTGAYDYSGSRPHAVQQANGVNYFYDACGNMTARGNNVMQYDEENRLRQYNGPSPQVTYGYADDGTRLWRLVNGSDLTVWIGGIYEERGGKRLCHVHANGQIIASFEQGGLFAYLPQNRVVGQLARSAAAFERMFAWPFQHGRTPFTVMLATLLGILCVSLLSRWHERIRIFAFNVQRSMFNVRCSRRPSSPRPSRPSLSSVKDLAIHPIIQSSTDPLFGSVLSLLPPVSTPSALDVRCSTLNVQCSGSAARSLHESNDPSVSRSPRLPIWRQALSVWLIVALVLATTETNVHAQVFDPVFYYYHTDHLGSSNIVTDRNGVIVQQYEYTSFGHRRVLTSGSAFPLTHRYTSQHMDEDTGLYYYQSRYYDPEIGRFTQPDSIVPSAANPQTLNRYSYVGNNPYKYTDPTGHVFGIDDLIIAVVVGAAIGAATSAANGGNVWMGALTGAIGGALGGLGSWAGGAIGGSLGGAAGSSVGAIIGAILGSAAGGAASAAVTGGDVAMGALTGAIAAGLTFGVGWFNQEILKGTLSEFSVTLIGSTLGGGVGAELQGGDFGEGARYGAMGAAIGAGVVGIVKIGRVLSEKWVKPPVDVSPPVPESLATDMEDVMKLNTKNNWWKNGMHGWHAGSNAAIASRLGPLALPFLWLAGLYHELPLDWRSFQGEQQFQGTVNHFLDSVMDIVANTYGMAVGTFLSPSAAMHFAATTGNYIPGPGDPDAAFGGRGRGYRGNPIDAWGQYP